MPLASTTSPPPPAPDLCVDHHGAAYGVRGYTAADHHERLRAFYDGFEPKRAAQGLPPLGRDRIDQWLASILPLGTHLVVEDTDGDVVGHAFLIDSGRAGEAEYAIFLRQDIRGRGIGTCVNRVAVAVARAAGWARLWLSAEPHNRPAIRSYQKVGFRFLASEFLAAEVEMALELTPTAGAA
jgi:L-amino acid N-acyltransferase YncA